MDTSLESMLCPKSIAVVGASADPAKWGHRLIRNTVGLGYRGRLWAVNPRHRVLIEGSEPATSVGEVEGTIDLAVAAVPQAAVVAVVRECARRGVQNLVIPASGFKETGDSGAADEHQILAIAREAGMRILGPNCFGVFSSIGAINTTPFAPIPGGDIALVSQSGNVAAQMFMAARKWALGFSHVVGLGNQLDISFAEVVGWLASDSCTQRIALYLEGAGAKEADGLVRALTRCHEAGKSVVVIKAGGSVAGRAVALSHTGSLATEDRVWEEVIRGTGAVRVHSIQDMFGVLALAGLPHPQGRRLAVLTDGGGDSIMAVDGVDRYGLELAEFSEDVQARLDLVVPPAAPRVGGRNPITLDTAGGVEDDPGVIPRCLEELQGAPGIDLVVVGGLYGTYEHVRDMEVSAAHAIIQDVQRGLSVVIQSPANPESSEPMRILQRAGVPVFADMDVLLSALTLWMPPATTAMAVQATPEVGDRPDGGWPAEKAYEMLTQAHVALPCHRFVDRSQDVVQAARDIGFPVCVKTADPSIIHKSDVGAVRVGITNTDELMAAAQEIALATGSERLLVMPHLQSGVEILMGARFSTLFGPVLVIGRGGIWTEVEDDTVTFVGEIADEGAFLAKLRTLRCSPMLFGARGQPGRDVVSLLPLARALMHAVRQYRRVSVELNPVILYDAGFGVADSRVVEGT